MAALPLPIKENVSQGDCATANWQGHSPTHSSDFDHSITTIITASKKKPENPLIYQTYQLIPIHSSPHKHKPFQLACGQSPSHPIMQLNWPPQSRNEPSGHFSPHLSGCCCWGLAAWGALQRPFGRHPKPNHYCTPFSQLPSVVHRTYIGAAHCIAIYPYWIGSDRFGSPMHSDPKITFPTMCCGCCLQAERRRALMAQEKKAINKQSKL